MVLDLASLSQILVGTKSLDVLYSKCDKENKDNFQSSFHGYQAVLKVLEARWRQTSSETLGYVKLRGNSLEVVPAGSTVVLDSFVHLHGPHTEKWVILGPASVTLPSGLLIANCLHTLPHKRTSKLSVLPKNGTQTDIKIPPEVVLVEIHAVQRVMNQQHQSLDVKAEKETLTSEFGDSPLPEDIKIIELHV